MPVLSFILGKLLGIIVRDHRNNFLSLGDYTAYGTLLTLGKTGSGTACCRCGKSLLGVTLCGNGSGSNKNCITYDTLLTCGITGLGTGGILCKNTRLGVAERINNLLCNYGLAADITLISVLKTGFGTGCILAGKENSLILGM